MALTKEQRERLESMLTPVMKETMQGMVSGAVQEAVAAALKEHKEQTTDYLRSILSSRDIDKLKNESDDGFGVARIARCMAMAHNDTDRAVAIAKDLYNDDLGDIVQKTLSSGDAEGGGVFVPSVLADTFIDALRARAVVRQAGPVVVDIANGSLRVPRVTADPTAGWVGEAKNRSASNLKTGSLNFTAKTLQGKSSVTQKLLSRSAQNAEQIIRNGLVRVMANVEDQAFLAGAGTEFTPKGMLNWAAAANKFNATQAGAAATLTEVQTDLNTAMSNLTDNDVDLDMARWFMSTRSRNYLAFVLRDTDDKPTFKDELTSGTPSLNGQQEFHSNNIPNNLGGGSNESKVYLAAMNYAWIAEEAGLRIRASSEASFEDDTGTTLSAFDYGLMVIILERDVDFAMAHPEAVSVIEAVKWGA